MKFAAQKTDFLEVLEKTYPVVATKSTLSILANALIETGEGMVVFTTTNLQVAVRSRMPATVLETGSTTLPARTLFEIARELQPGEITVEVDPDNVASISCGSSFFKVLGISREEFPRVVEFEGDPIFTMPQAVLKRLLHRTSFAVSREDPRHFLTGLYMVVRDGRLVLVGTDGRRLSRMEAELGTPPDFAASMIVPIKAIEELEKMLTTEGDALVFLSGNQVGFKVGTDLLVSLLIDAKFPDYEGVIPKTSAARAFLPREEFAAVVRQAALLTSEQSSSVRLAFKEGELVVTASTPELGEARVAMPVKFEGKPVTIGFNPRCLRDVLNCMDENEVNLGLTDSVSPGVIAGEGGFLHLIMPMRLPEAEG